MFLPWIDREKLLHARVDAWSLKNYPANACIIMCESVVQNMVERMDSMTRTPADVLFAMESIGHCFALPLELENSKIIRSAHSIYHKWLDQCPHSMKSLEQDFICMIVGHFSLLFDNRSQGLNIQAHVELAEAVIVSIQRLGQKRGHEMAPSTWEWTLRIVIGMTDSVLCREEADMLGDRITVSLIQLNLELLLRSMEFSGPYLSTWDTFDKYFKRWCHRLPVMLQWASAITHLTHQLLLELPRICALNFPCEHGKRSAKKTKGGGTCVLSNIGYRGAICLADHPALPSIVRKQFNRDITETIVWRDTGGGYCGSADVGDPSPSNLCDMYNLFAYRASESSINLSSLNMCCFPSSAIPSSAMPNAIVNAIPPHGMVKSSVPTVPIASGPPSESDPQTVLSVQWVDLEEVRPTQVAITTQQTSLTSRRYAKNNPTSNQATVSAGPTKLAIVLKCRHFAFAWHRILHCMGNPNHLRRVLSDEPIPAEVHTLAMEAITTLLDLCLAPGLGFRHTYSHPLFAHLFRRKIPTTSWTHGNTVLRLLGAWLFDAACGVDVAYTEGRSRAIAAIGRLMCSMTRHGINQPLAMPHQLRYLYVIERALHKDTTNDRVLASTLMYSSEVLSTYQRGTRYLIPSVRKVLQRLLKMRQASEATASTTSLAVLSSGSGTSSSATSGNMANSQSSGSTSLPQTTSGVASTPTSLTGPSSTVVATTPANASRGILGFGASKRERDSAVNIGDMFGGYPFPAIRKACLLLLSGQIMLPTHFRSLNVEEKIRPGLTGSQSLQLPDYTRYIPVSRSSTKELLLNAIDTELDEVNQQYIMCMMTCMVIDDPTTAQDLMPVICRRLQLKVSQTSKEASDLAMNWNVSSRIVGLKCLSCLSISVGEDLCKSARQTVVHIFNCLCQVIDSSLTELSEEHQCPSCEASNPFLNEIVIRSCFAALFDWVSVAPWIFVPSGQWSTLATTIFRTVVLGALSDDPFAIEASASVIGGALLDSATRRKARQVLYFMLRHSGNYPASNCDALSSLSNEESLTVNLPEEARKKYIRYFVINSATILTVIEQTSLGVSDAADRDVLVILRDVSGKYVWRVRSVVSSNDAKTLFPSTETIGVQEGIAEEKESEKFQPTLPFPVAGVQTGVTDPLLAMIRSWYRDMIGWKFPNSPVDPRENPLPSEEEYHSGQHIDIFRATRGRPRDNMFKAGLISDEGFERFCNYDILQQTYAALFDKLNSGGPYAEGSTSNNPMMGNVSKPAVVSLGFNTFYPDDDISAMFSPNTEAFIDAFRDWYADNSSLNASDDVSSRASLDAGRKAPPLPARSVETKSNSPPPVPRRGEVSKPSESVNAPPVPARQTDPGSKTKNAPPVPTRQPSSGSLASSSSPRRSRSRPSISRLGVDLSIPLSVPAVHIAAKEPKHQPLTTKNCRFEKTRELLVNLGLAHLVSFGSLVELDENNKNLKSALNALDDDPCREQFEAWVLYAHEVTTETDPPQRFVEIVRFDDTTITVESSTGVKSTTTIEDVKKALANEDFQKFLEALSWKRGIDTMVGMSGELNLMAASGDLQCYSSPNEEVIFHVPLLPLCTNVREFRVSTQGVRNAVFEDVPLPKTLHLSAGLAPMMSQDLTREKSSSSPNVPTATMNTGVGSLIAMQPVASQSSSTLTNIRMAPTCVILWNNTREQVQPTSPMWSDFKLMNAHVLIIIDPVGNGLYRIRVHYENSNCYATSLQWSQSVLFPRHIPLPASPNMVVNFKSLGSVVLSAAVTAMRDVLDAWRVQSSKVSSAKSKDSFPLAPYHPHESRQKVINSILKKFARTTSPGTFYSHLCA